MGTPHPFPHGFLPGESEEAPRRGALFLWTDGDQLPDNKVGKSKLHPLIPLPSAHSPSVVSPTLFYISFRRSGESRNPEHFINTGFRVAPGLRRGCPE